MKKISIMLILCMSLFCFCSTVKVLELDIIEITNIEKTLTKEVNLGEFKKNIKTVKKDFKIINKTSETIIINYAVTSCGCTIGTIEDEQGNKSDKFSKEPGIVADVEIKNNESVVIHIDFDITDEPKGDGIKLLKVFDDYLELILEIEMNYIIL